MASTVFHIMAEVRPVTSATLDPAQINGAFVRCLVPATSSDDAMSKLIARLRDDGMELIDTEWCVDFDQTDWESPGDSFEHGLADRARQTGEVQFDTFHTWGHDVPDAI